VVSPSTTKADLIAIAIRLHATDRESSFGIFDDDARFPQARAALMEIGGRSDRATEDWMMQHDLAIISHMLTGNGRRWQLLCGFSGRFGEPETVLADLE